MSNERLRDAIDAAGLTVDHLADRIEVDAKTIERWINQDRTPYRRHQTNVAQALGVTAHDLWPDANPLPDRTPAHERESDRSDLLAALAAEDELETPARGLLDDARLRVDMLGLTLADLIDAATVALLSEKAQAGCEIRILLSSPDSIHLHLHEQSRNPEVRLSDPSTLRWDVERTVGYLQPLLALATVQVRVHLSAPSVSILRVDDQLLATVHLLPATPGQEPVLHLRDQELGGLFARFAEHLDAEWETADTIAANPDRYPAPDVHPDRYRHPTDHDHDFSGSEAFTPAPPPTPSPPPERERKPSRVGRFRKPRA